MEQNGSKPELFGDIVRAAIALLERLIVKVMQRIINFAEKVIDKAVDAVNEMPKETESHDCAKDEPAIQLERPPQPKPSVLAGKYPRLKEIDGRLKEQNKAIFGREKKRNKLKKELSECTGIFKGASGRSYSRRLKISTFGFPI